MGISIIDFNSLCMKTKELKLPLPLIRKGYVQIIDITKDQQDLSNLELTILGQKLIDGKSVTDSSCVDWIEEYRNLFKDAKGRKGDRTTCSDKMCRFIGTYGFTKDDIIKGTQMYIDSLHGDFRYCVEADNFVFKKAEGSEKSKLLVWVEQAKDSSYVNGDWTKNII